MATESLDAALAEFQADPPVLVKDKKGQVGNQKTKYADLVQVNAVVLSRLNALGVIYKTKPTLRSEDPKFVLAYSLKHVASGQSEDGEYPLKLSENSQHMGSAISYARRYVLLSLTGVAADDEDDDGQAATSHRTAQRAAQPARQERPPADGRATAQRQAGPPLPGEGLITDPQQRKLHALLRDAAMGTREEGLAYISEVLGRDVASTKELTVGEASQVIDRLARYVEKSEPPESSDG
jgi:hypothetical protein